MTMTREELLRSNEWWLAEIQNDLYKVIYDHMNKHHLKKKDIAEKLNVSKGYISQVLNGHFDHKISKLIDLAMAFGKVPQISYIDLDEYIREHDKGEVKAVNKHGKPIHYFISINSQQPVRIDKDDLQALGYTHLIPDSMSLIGDMMASDYSANLL